MADDPTTEIVEGNPEFDGRKLDLPVVVALSDDEIETVSDDDLTKKIDEYAKKAPDLQAHHNFWICEMVESEGRYVQVFERVLLLEKLASTALGAAPGIELYEEIDLLGLDPSVVNAYAIGSTAVGGISMLFSFYQVHQANKAIKIAGAVGDDALKTLKATKRLRTFGAVTAVVSVVSGVAGLAISAENERRRRAYLETLARDYRSWFSTTTTSIEGLKSAIDEIEGEITALQEGLGFATFEEMVEALGGAVTQAGETDALIKSATRMLCAMPPVDVADVSLYTGLSENFVNRRKQQIASDPSLCNVT